MKRARVEIRSTQPVTSGEGRVFLRYGQDPLLAIGLELKEQWQFEVPVRREEGSRLLEVLMAAAESSREGALAGTGEPARLVLRDPETGQEAHLSVARHDSSLVIALARGAGANLEQREVAMPRELVAALAYQLEAALEWLSRYRPAG